MIIAINYHYIRKDYSNPYPSIYGVTPDAFAKQLDILLKFGKFISQADIKERIQRGDELDNHDIEFIITYDDGLREQFDEALPILNQKGIPAVFYVNSSNFENFNFSLVHQIHLLRSQISSGQFLELLHKQPKTQLNTIEKEKAFKHYQYDDAETAILKYSLNFKLTYEEQEEIVNQEFSKYFANSEKLHKQLYMSHEQLKELATLGYLGTHGHTHIPMGLYSKEMISDQINISKNYLEKLTETEIYGVSYPYGSLEACQGDVPLIAEKAGLVYGFTTERAGNFSLSKPLLMSRFNCNDLPGGKSNLFAELKVELVEKRKWFY